MTNVDNDGTRVALGFDAMGRPCRITDSGETSLLRTALDTIVYAVERHTMEKERARLESRLHRAQLMETVGTLTSGIAHNFNNILGGILGHSEVIEEHLGPDARPLQMSDAEFTKFIQARVDKFADASNKHDGAAIATFYSEDAVRVTPNGFQHGRAEIAKSMEDGSKTYNIREFVSVVEQAHQYGREGWAVGSFSAIISVPGDEAVHAKGLWADVFEHRGDQWFTRMDSYTNPPPPPPKPAH